jgi:hypothetical protein
VTDLGSILQSYIDERARRWAVAGERLPDWNVDKHIAHARMEEALAISQYIARMRGEGR